jgi:hypothetical protein
MLLLWISLDALIVLAAFLHFRIRPTIATPEEGGNDLRNRRP